MKAKQKYILGIDGGGTKTAMVLADQNCKSLASIETGQSNVHNASVKEITEQIRQGMFDLFKKARLSKLTRFDAVGIGLAGLDSKKDYDVAKNILKKALSGHLPDARKVKIVNDTVIGLWSGSQKKESICLIGGTGSNCYGVNKKGKEAWASGLGHVLADEGGGYYQGLRALKAAAKSFDGRGPKSLLEKMILKHYRVKDIRDLIPLIYYKPYGKRDIGQLAYLVEEACKKGDKVALRIASDSADELVLMVKAVAEKLKFKKQSFDLVLIGGVIQGDPFVNRRFKRDVRKLYPNVNFIIPKDKPVAGAVWLALSNLKK